MIKTCLLLFTTHTHTHTRTHTHKAVAMLLRRALRPLLSPRPLLLARSLSVSVEEAQRSSLRRLAESLNYPQEYLSSKLHKHFKHKAYAKPENARRGATHI